MVDYIVDALKEFVSWCFISLFKGLVKWSYIICLITACVGILLYIGGCKKAGRAVSVSIIIYVLLAALGGELIE